MNQPIVNSNSRVHIVGIGGAGMSAIARVLHERGIQVSGSDRQFNELTQALTRDGIKVYEGHNAANIKGATVLFVTSAATDTNPEIAAAKVAGIPVLTRREFFKQLLPEKTQIAVSGTHGKTTTTALITHILRELGKDPSYIVGGTLNSTGTNAHAGKGDAFVVEADEYGYMFLGLQPQIAIITNVEHDHPDIFPSLEDVLKAFREFVALLPDNGLLIACADDPNAAMLAEERRRAGKPVVTYGFHVGDWRVTKPNPAIIPLIQSDNRLTDYLIISPSYNANGNSVISRTYRIISLLPGDHNMLNTLAALIVTQTLGIPLEEATQKVTTFTGTGRRFEVMGEVKGVTVLNDYAHHPTAIRATLQATRQRYPDGAIFAVWQPHTYSRTRLLADEFARCFHEANYVLITDIYAAREQAKADDPTPEKLAIMAHAAGHGDARASGSIEATASELSKLVRKGDVVIIFSAGDAPKIGEKLLAYLQNHEIEQRDGSKV